MKSDDIRKQITDIVNSYEKMLITSMDKGTTFDSAPFTLSLQGLLKILEQQNND
jgi:hypothetical protein